MAAAPTLPLVSVEEYLNSSYRPDREFVDGFLVERSVPTIPHSVLQMILIQYFLRFQESLRFLTMPEVRTQIIERARYRVPDVMLCPKPLPKGKIVTTIPWAVIEIVSPDDRLSDTLERFRDYAEIGIKQLVLMDPESFVAHRYEDGSLIRTDFQTLLLPSDSSVPFDSELLFSQLRAHLSEE
jgi:Uma2 family endonuclease